MLYVIKCRCTWWLGAHPSLLSPPLRGVPHKLRKWLPLCGLKCMHALCTRPEAAPSFKSQLYCIFGLPLHMKSPTHTMSEVRQSLTDSACSYAGRQPPHARPKDAPAVKHQRLHFLGQQQQGRAAQAHNMDRAAPRHGLGLAAADGLQLLNLRYTMVPQGMGVSCDATRCSGRVLLQQLTKQRPWRTSDLQCTSRALLISRNVSLLARYKEQHIIKLNCFYTQTYGGSC